MIVLSLRQNFKLGTHGPNVGRHLLFQKKTADIRPVCMSLCLTEAGKTNMLEPAVNRLPINALRQWRRALTGVFWREAVPLSEQNSSAGEIAVLTLNNEYSGSDRS